MQSFEIAMKTTPTSALDMGIWALSQSLERWARLQKSTFLYCFDDDVTSLSVGLGKLGSDNILGNNHGCSDPAVIAWLLQVLARSFDFIGMQATSNLGFARLLVNDLRSKFWYCTGACFGYCLSSLSMEDLHIDFVGVGEDVVRPILVSYQSVVRQLRCFRFNMLTAPYACFSPGSQCFMLGL